jgi:glycosyltransferase involved in cell wall biosynthesis
MNPKLSISLITYNQREYISQSIDSALSQVTDFDFEIVLSDDCSTDGTRDICIEYKERYPDKIRLILHEKNIGAVKNYISTYQACNGEYVAYLEGDDYFTDINKLQKQVDFLETNSDYVICCHHVKKVNENDESSGKLLPDYPDTLSVNDLCEGDFISTASCVVRNNLLDEIPDWIYNFLGCDWTFDILNAEKGKIKFLPDVMAAYRVHPDGLWSGYNEIKKLEITIEMVENLNKYLNYKYDKEFGGFLFKLNKVLIRFLKEEYPEKNLNKFHDKLKKLEKYKV